MKRRLRDEERSFSEMAKQPCTCCRTITAKYRRLYVVQLVLLTALLQCSLATESLRIRFLSSGPDERMSQLERETYAGLALAAERINSSPSKYGNISFSIERSPAGRSPKETLNELFHSGVTTVFHNAEICEQVAAASAAWNRIMISPVCGEDIFSDKNKYPTFLRTRPSHAQVTHLLARLVAHHKLRNFAVAVQNSSEWTSVFKSFERQAESFGLNVVHSFVFNDYEKCCKLDLPCCESYWPLEFFRNARTLTNTFLFFGDYRNLKQLSKMVEIAQPTDAENYLFLSIDMEAFSSARLQELAKGTGRRKTSSYYEQLLEPAGTKKERRTETGTGPFPELFLITRKPYDTELIAFESEIRSFINKVFPTPFNNDLPMPVSVQAMYAYDALMVYAGGLIAALRSQSEGIGDLKKIALDGRKLFKIIEENSDFTGISGDKLSFDALGDIAKSFVVAGTVRQDFSSNTNRDALVPIGSFKNDTYLGTPQLFAPCRFLFDKASADQKFSKSSFFVSYAIVNLLIANVALHFFLHALRKKVKEFDALILAKDLTTEDELYEELSNTHLIRVVNRNVPSMADDWRTPVWCSKFKLSNSRSIFQRDTLAELSKMRALRHPNIATFFTAVVQSNQLLMISEYEDNGTLEKVLSDDAIILVPRIVHSLLTSLVEGMTYLHNSQINYHGNLNSSKCLVSSNWSLKITGFGIQSVRRTFTTHRDLLWTAPEILRNPDILGTQEGDVYSFAIVMHELVYRLGPFAINIAHKSSEDIVRKVQRGIRENRSPYRPPLGKSPLSAFHTCMIECWAEDPEDRPTFTDVSRYLEKLKPKFDTDLPEDEEECLVIQREIDRLDEILQGIIPKSVADRLASGAEIEPELWENVTVFEADLVGFTEIARERSPLGTLILLDDLYKLFDSIAQGYDVCKMETEGDAYIVVSHTKSEPMQSAGEIASMALEFVEELKNAKICHKGKPVVVRIGVHTGSVAAGVVGKVHPTFSIVGDAAKVASSMQSTSAELRIQLSESSYRALQEIGGYITEERYCESPGTSSTRKTYWLVGHEKQTTRRKRKQSSTDLKPLCNRQSIISLSSTDIYVEPLKAQ